MANSLDRRPDGSIALFINGDLQFDSNDEHIYHEALVLPALAIATRRKTADLRALIIGGGDGLVARELFKSRAVSTIDLVDYDPQILSVAKSDIAEINNKSLFDPRLSTHINDAWEFVDKAIEQNLSFDIIISDLTVAEDTNGTKFHSIDWYNKISQLLTTDGILAVNAVSPQATPEAYWSVFNSILKGGLHPRPYHAHIPSFASLGFGQSWGYFIAAAKSITTNEIENTKLAEPRKFLRDINHLQELFNFPQELFEYQNSAVPALAGSDILLHYFANASVCSTTSGLFSNSLNLNTDSLSVPAADTGKRILPPELKEALAKSIFSTQQNTNAPQVLLEDVLQLMPSLQKEHTPEIIADFLQDPGHFLEAIDLPELVKRLLKRAAELPSIVVAELELLSDKLNEWAGDHLSLLSLGKRVVTILTLVIVVGNLLYPDSVYGKGHTGHGNGGRGGLNGGYGTTYWNPRPYNRTTTNVIRKPAPAQTKNIHTTPATTGMAVPVDSNLALVSYLSTVVRDAQATRNRLQKNQADYISYGEILKSELSAYETTDNLKVNYGSHELPKVEAIRRTKLALKRTISKIDSLTKSIDQLPVHVDLAKIALANLTQGSDA